LYNYEYVGDPKQIQTKFELLVATGFTRVVLGDRGAYVEFTDDQILPSSLCILTDQLWRIRGPGCVNVYYVEYRTLDDVKVYHQKRRVNYADYIPGRWYISPIYLKDFVIGEQL